MAVTRRPTAPERPRRRPPLVPAGFDWPVLVALVAGFARCIVPSYLELARTIWATDEQGHGPIILAVSGWLLYMRRHDLAAPAVPPVPWLGLAAVRLCDVLYAFGTGQYIIMFEVGSQILVLAALLLLFRGAAALRVRWFPLFFLIFMVPLPEALVAAVTGPLKRPCLPSPPICSIAWATRSGAAGVVMTVGQYQLLVADACAGLNSMFTLEALGLLYMNLMKYTSLRRNVVLAMLLIPISFAANIVRVMILVLVTYHFGDEAGPGFRPRLRRHGAVHGGPGADAGHRQVAGVVHPGSAWRSGMKTSQIKAVIVFVLMAASFAVATAWKPTEHLADQRAKIDLETLFPRSFGEWTVDDRMPVQLVSPDTQALLNKIYNQTLSRTYVNKAGERIMLSVAYGGDQSDATRAHRPEVCYPAQGFQMLNSSEGSVNTPTHPVRVRHLVAKTWRAHRANHLLDRRRRQGHGHWHGAKAGPAQLLASAVSFPTACWCACPASIAMRRARMRSKVSSSPTCPGRCGQSSAGRSSARRPHGCGPGDHCPAPNGGSPRSAQVQKRTAPRGASVR